MHEGGGPRARPPPHPATRACRPTLPFTEPLLVTLFSCVQNSIFTVKAGRVARASAAGELLGLSHWLNRRLRLDEMGRGVGKRGHE